MCNTVKELLLDCSDLDKAGGLNDTAYLILARDLDTFSPRYSANDFSATATYAVDDLVKYEGEIYKCTSIHGPAAWDAGNFELIVNANVNVSAPHVPAAGKGFIKLQYSQEESQLTLESTGKRFMRGGKPTAELFYPGGTEDAASFAARVKNEPVVLLLPLRNGKYQQIGEPGSPAEINPDYATGTASSDDNRWKFEVSAYQSAPLFYNHAIPEPA